MPRKRLIYLFFALSMCYTWALRSQDLTLADMASNLEVFKIDLKNAALINTKSLEYSPAYFGDGIVFVSSRVKGISVKDKNINEGFFDLYFAPFNEEGMPHQAELFSPNISSPLHVGSATFDAAQDLIYFTRNSRALDTKKKKSRKSDNVQKVFEGQRGPKDWVNIHPLPFNSDSFNIVTPALSPDNKRLYFASDMLGGYGGMDLYYVERIGDSWSAPINLGPGVNTARNEVFPFIAANGDLYFSSNGWSGLGGLDIFVSKWNGKNWEAPKNVGAPINSREDDFGICMTANGFEGFFSSNRPGGRGKDDIYRFRVELKEDLPYVQSQLVLIDTESRRRLEGVSLRMYEILPNGALAVNCPFYSFLDDQGELAFAMKQRAVLDVPFQRTDINGMATAQFFKQKQYLLVADKAGYERTFVRADGASKEVRIEMTPESDQDCLEINAFIIDDSREKGIDQATIILVNRQTRDRSTQESRKDGSFSLCLQRQGEYEISIQKPGYVNKKEIIIMSGLTDTDWISKTYRMSPAAGFDEADIEEGAVIVLNHIYYDYNSAELRRDATKELDDLAVIMKRFPSMEIELISHTDSRGDWLYNQKLSLQRAESAKRYLISRGVEGQRIQALGYGESQIRNHCIDGIECTEEEHAFNRRTEVRIISMKEQNLRIEYDKNASGNK